MNPKTRAMAVLLSLRCAGDERHLPLTSLCGFAQGVCPDTDGAALRKYFSHGKSRYGCNFRETMASHNETCAVFGDGVLTMRDRYAIPARRRPRAKASASSLLARISWGSDPVDMTLGICRQARL